MSFTVIEPEGGATPDQPKGFKVLEPEKPTGGGKGFKVIAPETAAPAAPPVNPWLAAFKAHPIPGDIPTLGESFMKPFITLPEKTPTNIPEGVATSVVQGVNSIFSPVGIASIGAVEALPFLRPLIAAIFGDVGAQNVKKEIEQYRQIPKPTGGQTGQLIGDVAQGGAMVLPMAHGLAPRPEVPGVPPPPVRPAVPLAETDLQSLAGVLNPEERAAVPTAKPIVARVPEVGDRIKELESQVAQVAKPGEMKALQQERRYRKLTDGQWLAVLEEWNRRQQEPTTAETTPSKESAPAKPTLPHPELQDKGVAPLVLGPIGEVAPLPKAEPVQARPMLPVDVDEILKRQRVERFVQPAETDLATTTGTVPPLAVSTELRPVPQGKGTSAVPIQRRPLTTLLNDFGITTAKGKQFSDKIADVSDAELFDKYEQAQKVHDKMRVQEHPDVAGAIPTQAAERNALWDEIDRRFTREFERRGLRSKQETGFTPEELENIMGQPTKTREIAPITIAQAKEIATKAGSTRVVRHLDAMGLDKPGATLHSVLENMGKNPVIFGAEQSALAKHYAETFGHVLPMWGVEVGNSPRTGRGAAHLDSKQAYLGVPFNVDEQQGYFTPGDIALHEAGHAISHWQVTYPKTFAQREAAGIVGDVINQAKDRLSPEVRQFFDDVYTQTDWHNREQADATLAEMSKRGIDPGIQEVLYALASPSEMTASFASRAVRNFLDFKYKATSAWESVRNAVKTLLGLKTGTAADKMFDTITELGKESRNAPVEGYYTDTVLGAPVTAPAGGTTVLRDATTRERAEGWWNRILGRSMPRTSAVNQDAANKGVRYAVARDAAPVVARSLATDVLGKHFKNSAFDRVLGDVIVEDLLRGIKQGWNEAANRETDPVKKAEYIDMMNKVKTLIGRPDHRLRTEGQFQALLKNKDIKDSIQRHRELVMPLAEEAHKELGGKLAVGGENTGAFANLIAIQNPDDVEAVKGMVYGSRQGDITNPLKRGSVFSKQRKGSAEDYESSYRKMAERMIRGNYEQKALREYYTALEENGLAVVEKPGTPPPKTLGGQPTRKITVELRGAGPGMTRQRNLWIRADLFDEAHQALALDRKPPKAAWSLFLDSAAELQIAGATDAVWHSANMWSAIAGSQGGRSFIADLTRRTPGVNFIDTGARLAKQFRRVVMNDADVQRELAQIAEVGAGRAETQHEGMLQKGLKATGIPGAEVASPSFWTSKFIKSMDKAGRLALNDMFDNLVERKMVQDTPEGRRDFVNKMGQYNDRLLGYYASKARAIGLSNFVVAGKTFNRLAVQKILFGSGQTAFDAEALLKAKTVEAWAWISTLLVVPVLANLYMTGKPFGRNASAIPVGAIDTGKDSPDGRPIYIDPAQLTGYRRALRITGAEVVGRDIAEEQSLRTTANDWMTEVFKGYVQPWEGPAVRTAKIGVTGYDTSGYLLSPNPDDHIDNAVAALKNVNPMLGAFYRAKETGYGGVGQSLYASTGIGKTGRFPSYEERSEQKTKAVEAGTEYEGTPFSKLPLAERAKVQRAVDKERKANPKMNVEAEREAARRDLFRTFAKEDALRSQVAPEVQSWLDKNKLKLSGFKNELTVAGAKLPLTRDEQKEYLAEVVKQYNEVISTLRESQPEATLDHGALQDRLNKRLTMARTRARNHLRQSIQSKASESRTTTD